MMAEDSLVDLSAVAGTELPMPGPLPTAQDPNPTDGNLDTVGGRDMRARFSIGAVQATPYGLLRVEPGLAMRVARFRLRMTADLSRT